MTTLYNHNVIGTASKPLITNLNFKLVHESLQRGETKMYEEFKEKYSFESVQKDILEDEYRKIKKSGRD